MTPRIVLAVLGLAAAVIVVAMLASDETAVEPAVRGVALVTGAREDTGESVASTPVDAPAVDELLVRVEWSDGTPAVGINVAVTPHWNAGPFAHIVEGKTDDRGECRLASLEPGVHTLLLDRVVTEPVDVAADTPTETLITIPDGIDISGVVVDRRGEPIAGASIALDMILFERTREATVTDAEGRFAIRDAHMLQAIYVTHPLYQAAVPVDVMNTERVTVTLIEGARRLRGVVHAETGEPVPEALVVLAVHHEETYGRFAVHLASPHVARTDSAGRYAFEGLAAKPVTVDARAPGFARKTDVVDLSSAGEHELDITLRHGWTVHGAVTDEDGEPLQHATVRWGDWSFGNDLQWSTGADGRFRLDRLPPDWHTSTKDIVVEHREHLPASSADFVLGRAGVDFVPGPVVEWNPVLRGGGEISGLVVPPDDESLAGVLVHLMLDGQDVDVAGLRDGRFHFAGLVDGLYTVNVDKIGFGTVASQSRVSVGSDLTLHIESFDPARVVGRVVSLRDERPTISLRRAYKMIGVPVDDDGRFDVELLPGEYHVEVETFGFITDQAITFIVKPGETFDLGDVEVIPREGGVYVRLDLPEGIRERDVQLSLRRADLNSRSSRFVFDDDGIYRASGGAGEHVVVVRGKGAASAAYPVTIDPRRAQELAVRVEKGYPLALDVRTGDGGRSLGVLDVTVLNERRQNVDSRRLPMQQGTRRVELWLAPGWYEVQLDDDAGRRAFGSVEITEDGAPLAVHLP